MKKIILLTTLILISCLSCRQVSADDNQASIEQLKGKSEAVFYGKFTEKKISFAVATKDISYVTALQVKIVKKIKGELDETVYLEQSFLENNDVTGKEVIIFVNRTHDYVPSDTIYQIVEPIIPNGVIINSNSKNKEFIQTKQFLNIEVK